MSNVNIEADDYPRVAERPWWRLSYSALVVILVVLSGLGVKAYFTLQDAALLAACRPYSVTWITDSYGETHQGIYPPLSPTPGRLMFAEGLEQPVLHKRAYVDFLCESDPDADFAKAHEGIGPIDDTSYIYLGYVIENQAQLEVFAEAYRRITAEGGNFEGDIPVLPGQGTCGGDKIVRLRDAERLIKDYPQLAGRLHEIPLVIEWPDHHRGPKAKIITLAPTIYKDADGKEARQTGTMEVRRFPGEWPMTEEAIAVLRSLDALGRVS